ncbi:MAG: DUF4199 family protein [Bacteroidia bacterium]
MSIKPEIKFGILCALGIIAWTLIQYLAGFHSKYLYWGQYTGYFSYLLILYFLWKGLNEKMADKPGSFTMRRGIREGLIQLTITAGFSSLFMFVYDYKINPLWVEEMISFQRSNGSSTGYFLKFANDPGAQAIILSNTETHLCLYFLSILIVGSSMAFMISAILINKKENPSATGPRT